MRRQMGSIWNRRANLLLTVAGTMAAMLCMAPGCQMTEGPMAWSPEGKQIAFTTIEPFHTDRTDFPAGPQAFRLMVVEDRKALRVLEESIDVLLTAPGYSPDGQRMAYLRIPLLTREQQEAQGEKLQRMGEIVEPLIDNRWNEWWSGSGPEQPATQPAQIDIGEQDDAASITPVDPPEDDPAAVEPADAPATQPTIEMQDMALPPVKQAYPLVVGSLFLPDRTAHLVVRDVRTGRVVSETRIDLPAGSLADVYMHARPQYDPTGQWVHVAAGGLVLAVNPTTGQKQVLATGSSIARLSPDGKTVAICMPDSKHECSMIGLISTDGELAVYRRIPSPIAEAPSWGPFWIDEQTLGLLGEDKKASGSQTQPAGSPAAATQPATTQATQPAEPAILTIERLRRDGKMLEPIRIVLPAAPETSEIWAEGLAFAPDGRHLVIGVGKSLYFATLDGKILGQWQSDEQVALSQPVFSPDSRTVAVKLARQVAEKVQRTEAIAFFTNEGKPLNRVPVPPIKAGTTRPAGPETQPAETE